METYTTLDGRVLDLTQLTDEERRYFERCLNAYREGIDWIAFRRLVDTTENPLLGPTGGRITQAIWDHPLFQAARDLEDRLGIQQGHIAPDHGDNINRDPVQDEWIPATEAAHRKGVTLPGLHGAIDRGAIIARPAKPGGTRLVVSVNSLHAWNPNPVRQAARKKAS